MSGYTLLVGLIVLNSFFVMLNIEKVVAGDIMHQLAAGIALGAALVCTANLARLKQ